MRLSTLAIDTSERLDGGGRVLAALRYADLGLLALALPAFVLYGWPLLGYGVLAGAWLAQRVVHLMASRHAARAVARGDRRGALGALAGATLARVWITSLAILLVGLAEREAGLAAAVLAAVLFTAYLSSQLVVRLFAEGGE